MFYTAKAGPASTSTSTGTVYQYWYWYWQALRPTIMFSFYSTRYRYYWYRINRADVLILLYQVEDVPGRSCRINHANIIYEYLVLGTLYVVTGMIDCIMPDWYWY